MAEIARLRDKGVRRLEASPLYVLQRPAAVIVQAFVP